MNTFTINIFPFFTCWLILLGLKIYFMKKKKTKFNRIVVIIADILIFCMSTIAVIYAVRLGVPAIGK
jgi:hypothetical protein